MHYYLVTAFNQESYIEATLISIRQQYSTLAEFFSEARVLVLDDASTDGTAEIIADWVIKHPNAKLYSNSVNRGIGYNRNALLDWCLAEGLLESDYVQFVDGDDLLVTEQRVIKLKAFAREPQVEVVGGQLGLFYGNCLSQIHTVDTFHVDPDVQAIASIFECHVYISNAMFRGGVFLDHSVRFPETKTSEDWLFFLLHPLMVRHVPQVTLRYRRHESNLTNLSNTNDYVHSVRNQAHTLALLRAGLMPTTEDCQLLDLVGYLTFRLQSRGLEFEYKPSVVMPWFELLDKAGYTKAQWAEIDSRLVHLFDRIQRHNKRCTYYHPGKLQVFLESLRNAAWREINKCPAQ